MKLRQIAMSPQGKNAFRSLQGKVILGAKHDRRITAPIAKDQFWSSGQIMTPKIPMRLYQTWKSADLSQMDRPMRRWVQSWPKCNSDLEINLFDDAKCREFVKQSHPDLLAVYDNLNAVEQADLWRYLVILTLGGVYSDIDTICKIPFSEWINATDEAVIGIDGDYLNRYPNWQPEGRILSGGAYNFGLPWHDNVVAFCNWTFAARRGHPILKEVVRRINVNVGDPFFRDIAPDWTIKKTGPGVLTDVLYDWLADRNVRAEDLVRDLRSVRHITIDNVRFVDRPAFHWRYVKHFGMGSWKPPSVVVAWRKLSKHWS